MQVLILLVGKQPQHIETSCSKPHSKLKAEQGPEARSPNSSFPSCSLFFPTLHPKLQAVLGRLQTGDPGHQHIPPFLSSSHPTVPGSWETGQSPELGPNVLFFIHPLFIQQTFTEGLPRVQALGWTLIHQKSQYH